MVVSKYVTPREVILNSRNKGRRENWTGKGKVTLKIFANLKFRELWMYFQRKFKFQDLNVKSDRRMFIFQGVLKILEYVTWLSTIDWPLLTAKLSKQSPFTFSFFYINLSLCIGIFPTIFLSFSITSLSTHVPGKFCPCPYDSFSIFIFFSTEIFLPALCNGHLGQCFNIFRGQYR